MVTAAALGVPAQSTPAGGTDPAAGFESDLAERAKIPFQMTDAAGIDPLRVALAAYQPDTVEGDAQAPAEVPDNFDEGPEAGDRWRFDVQPFVWIPTNVDVDSTVSGATVNVDLSFDDVIDTFEVYGVTGRVEVWRDDTWGFVLEGLFIDLDSEDLRVQEGALSRPGRIVTKQAMADLALAWRVVDSPLSDTDPRWPRLSIDLFGGGRYQYLKQEITPDEEPTLGRSKDWVEPLAGGRVRLVLDEVVALWVRGDVSGFGIGSASDLTWNLAAGVDIGLSGGGTLKLGYRVLDMDYENGRGGDRLAFDGTLHGPWVGLSLPF
ncbi:MAG: hypothetical protein ACYS0G_14155 [Planctomycetota bacterium]|jgi:hypothetical protein